MNSKDAYLENMIKTASPAKLVELLYEKAIDSLNNAIEKINEKKLKEANEDIKKAEDIIMELNLSLDMEKGGQISQNLRALYNYMFRRLVDGNVKKDVDTIAEVRDMLKELLDAWKEATKKAGNTAELTKGRPSSGFDINI